MSRRFPALALLVFAGCSSLAPTENLLPDGAVPMTALAEYQGWFGNTEACSRLSGRFNNIRWYVVPGAETFQTTAGPKVGMWEKIGSEDRIIIAGRYVDHEMVVSHEILHYLLDREGHPPEYFVDRCHLTWESWSTTHVGD